MAREKPIEEAFDEVYRARPDEFVATRDAVAAGLRDDGDNEAAKRVKTARKPTLAAWAVNQVALTHRDALAAALGTGDALREHATDAAALKQLTQQLRAEVAGLRDVAAASLRDIGTDPGAHVDEIQQTFMTAAVRPDLRDDVVAGRLTKPLPAAGFGGLAGMDVAPEHTAGAADQAARRRELRDVEQEITRLERRVERLEGAARQAADRVARIEKELAAARATVVETEAELARTRSDLSALRDRADDLR